jgi:tetratricopeptide (TPR) repeat protein
MPGHHFISYSPADALDFARRLKKALGDSKLPTVVWLDKDELRPGSDWDEQIVAAIRSCESTLFVMSRDSVEAHSVCKREWQRALKYKIPIVPLLLHPDAEMPFLLDGRQFLAFTGDFDPAVEQLREHLRWLASPAGLLHRFEERLADARRDLRRALTPEETTRIKHEIAQLEQDISQQKKIAADPEAALRRSNATIARALEEERRPAAAVAVQAVPCINALPMIAPQHFQDRLVETRLICDFLRDDARRLAFVVGRGGVGKTAMICRLLLRIAKGLPPEGTGDAIPAVAIISLSSVGSRTVCFPALFEELFGLVKGEGRQEIERIYKNPQATMASRMKALLTALPAGRIIVLLDNFEDVVEPETHQLRDSELEEALQAVLTAAAHGVKVLITTRVVPRDLAFVEPGRQMRVELDRGLQSPYAEEVLRQMDVDGSVGLKNASPELLDEARRRTLGFPRALEALFAILSVDRHTTLRELLSDTSALLPDQVVQCLVGEAFSRLDRLARHTMQALAIYNRPVHAAAIDYLLQPHAPGTSTKQILNRLVTTHLVRKEDDRYYLHPVDWAYAASRIPQGEPGDAATEPPPYTRFALAHCAADFFLRARRPQEECRSIADVAAQLAEIDLRGEAGEWETAAGVILEIDYMLEIWGHFRLKVELYERVVPHLPEGAFRASCEDLLGWAHYRIGNYERALGLQEEALATAVAKNERYLSGQIQSHIAVCYGDLGRTEKTIECLRAALAIFTDSRDLASIAVCQNNIGFYLADLGEVHAAVALHTEALKLDEDPIARANLGARLADLGEFKDALVCCESALSQAEAIPHVYCQAVALAYIGDIHFDAGDLPGAREAYDHACRIAIGISNSQFAMHALVGLACTRFFAGEINDARINIEKACEYHVPRTTHKVQAMRGLIALRQEDRRAAQMAFRTALQEADRVLAHTPRHVIALEARALARAGLALCGEPVASEAILDAFRTAIQKREPANCKRLARLLDAIASTDREGVLDAARAATLKASH